MYKIYEWIEHVRKRTFCQVNCLLHVSNFTNIFLVLDRCEFSQAKWSVHLKCIRKIFRLLYRLQYLLILFNSF